MNTKKRFMLIVGALCTVLSLQAQSKVTLADAYEQNRAANERRRAMIDANVERQPLKPVWGSSSGTQVKTFKIGEGLGYTKTYLERTNGWVCTLSGVSGFYGRGLKGFNLKIFKEDGYWKLSKGRGGCGGCSTGVEAICWKTD